jgi:hypothetical protein
MTDRSLPLKISVHRSYVCAYYTLLPSTSTLLTIVRRRMRCTWQSRRPAVPEVGSITVSRLSALCSCTLATVARVVCCTSIALSLYLYLLRSSLVRYCLRTVCLLHSTQQVPCSRGTSSVKRKVWSVLDSTRLIVSVLSSFILLYRTLVLVHRSLQF